MCSQSAIMVQLWQSSLLGCGLPALPCLLMGRKGQDSFLASLSKDVHLISEGLSLESHFLKASLLYTPILVTGTQLTDFEGTL